jgi:hypothetical protein
MANQTITITFVSETGDGGGGAGNEIIQVELDSERNNGKTRFLFGEKAYFKIYKYPSTMRLTLDSTDGTIFDEGSGTSDEEELITFSNSNEGSADKPIKSVTSSNWIGRSLGSISAAGRTVTASQKGIGVLDFKYKADFIRKSISVPVKDGYDEYPVVVLVSGGEE